jgi:hypothetical protein
VGEKDTLRNVGETGEFTISLASRPLIEEVNASSASYGANVDEAHELGMVASVEVATPRVAASPPSIECRLQDTLVRTWSMDDLTSAGRRLSPGWAGTSGVCRPRSSTSRGHASQEDSGAM